MECLILNSSFSKNALSNLSFYKVHNWQDTKYAVEIRNCEINNGDEDGLRVHDSGILLQGSVIKENKGHGVHVS